MLPVCIRNLAREPSGHSTRNRPDLARFQHPDRRNHARIQRGSSMGQAEIQNPRCRGGRTGDRARNADGGKPPRPRDVPKAPGAPTAVTYRNSACRMENERMLRRPAALREPAFCGRMNDPPSSDALRDKGDWRSGSAGALHAQGQRFESVIAHQKQKGRKPKPATLSRHPPARRPLLSSTARPSACRKGASVRYAFASGVGAVYARAAYSRSRS